MTASKYYAKQRNKLRNKRTGVTGGHAGETTITASLTMPQNPPEPAVPPSFCKGDFKPCLPCQREVPPLRRRDSKTPLTQKKRQKGDCRVAALLAMTLTPPPSTPVKKRVPLCVPSDSHRDSCSIPFRLRRALTLLPLLLFKYRNLSPHWSPQVL